jgi:hypothetical protein
MPGTQRLVTLEVWNIAALCSSTLAALPHVTQAAHFACGVPDILEQMPALFLL